MADTGGIDWNAFLAQLGPQGQYMLGGVLQSLGYDPRILNQGGAGTTGTTGTNTGGGTSIKAPTGGSNMIDVTGGYRPPNADDPYTWFDPNTGQVYHYNPGTGWTAPDGSVYDPNNPIGYGPGYVPADHPGHDDPPVTTGHDPNSPITGGPGTPVPGDVHNTPANAWGSQNPLFQQGSNSKATGDAWSTSPDWRPEAPTGGLYGAFSELAGGGLTPYENQVGQGYQQFAQGGFNPNEQAIYNQFGNLANQLGQYARTPGTAEYASYDAYNKMLNSGYSPEEQAAISASGMKGARQQYDQMRDQMERQSRATGGGQGYYAAMTNMAGQQAAGLGEQARQNQILFANEKQRRAETGAQGMTGVAGLGAQRTQFGLGQQAGLYGQQQGMNQAGRQYQLAGLQGAQGWSGYGRGLQQAGLQGLQNLMQASQQGQGSIYGLIGNLLGTPRESYSELGQTTGNFNISAGTK